MGRYSRKDMIEFANFAKSYQSPKKVDDAYAYYLKGIRFVTKKESTFQKILKSNIVYLNGKIVKSRQGKEEIRISISDLKDAVVERWNRRTKVLYLKGK
jgi:hypothetical protein